MSVGDAKVIAGADKKARHAATPANPSSGGTLWANPRYRRSYFPRSPGRCWRPDTAEFRFGVRLGCRREPESRLIGWASPEE